MFHRDHLMSAMQEGDDRIPDELREIFSFSQKVQVDDLSKVIKAAKELHEFREEMKTDETFHDLKARIDVLEAHIKDIWEILMTKSLKESKE